MKYLIILLLSSCSRTNYGQCVGPNAKENPELRYINFQVLGVIINCPVGIK